MQPPGLIVPWGYCCDGGHVLLPFHSAVRLALLFIVMGALFCWPFHSAVRLALLSLSLYIYI